MILATKLTFTRRHFIAGAAASAFAAPAILSAQSIWRRYPFSLGVAAGDPSPDGFVVWTQLVPAVRRAWRDGDEPLA